MPGAEEPGQDPGLRPLVCPAGDPWAAGARGTWARAMTQVLRRRTARWPGLTQRSAGERG